MLIIRYKLSWEKVFYVNSFGDRDTCRQFNFFACFFCGVLADDIYDMHTVWRFLATLIVYLLFYRVISNICLCYYCTLDNRPKIFVCSENRNAPKTLMATLETEYAICIECVKFSARL